MVEDVSVYLLVGWLLWAAYVCYITVPVNKIRKFFNPNPYPGAVEDAVQYCEENRLNTAWGHRFEEVRRRAAYYRAWPNCQDEISYYICGDGVREP